MSNADRVVHPEVEDSPSSWLAENAVTLVVVAGVVGLLAYKGIDFTVAALVLVGLGLVIFVHELGHFLAAKACDVYVETFSIGFGPSLPLCRYKWGETTYKIGVIPLGGYVKMLGEGSESEEGEDDPRSYKNKSVPQRMLIISAGVIMNMIFAIVVFVAVYMGPGVDRGSGVVGVIDPGSPAWEEGVRSGAMLTHVGGIDNPYFDQIKAAIALSDKGESVPIEYRQPGGKTTKLMLSPRFEAENSGQRLIGIYPAPTTIISGAPKLDIPPVVPGSAADQAEPPLEHLDRIVGYTDPAGNLVKLRHDPRNPAEDRRDYFQLHEQLVDRAGEAITLQVARGSADSTPIEIKVPPAYARKLGMVMRIDNIYSVRKGSSAAEHLLPRVEGGYAGDLIEYVEVAYPDGKVKQFSNSKEPLPGNVTRELLDPMRLPVELNRWAAHPGWTPQAKKTVKVGVFRPIRHDDRKTLEFTLDWDDSWKYARELSLSVRSPISIPGLGLAYRVNTQVANFEDGSPAKAAGVEVDDVVKSVKFYRDEAGKKVNDVPLRPDEWAFAFSTLNEQTYSGRIDLTLSRAGKTVEITLSDLPVDKTWPLVERGFSFEGDTIHQEAESVGEAIGMGFRRVTDTAKNVYLSLRSMVTGGISFLKNANGPLEIARAGYYVASESVVKFCLLLAVLSVNLAVLNFLPIPVLDGGHMVFLAYEGVRGRPAPEVIRTTATFAGMALLLSLMACVLFLDFWKLIFKS